LITAAQLRAARALLGLDQRALAHAARLSLPTIQRMEASEGVIRGTVDSLVKLIAALEAAGIELINDRQTSTSGGRGVRLREAVAKHERVPARTRIQDARRRVVGTVR
jgi:transcriptional regulator with XRE-family HTH domain